LQIADWLDDLGEFPASVVGEACMLWRRQGDSRRPLPGEIRKLCKEAMPQKPSATLALPRSTDEYQRYDANRKRELETAAEAREHWAQERGCKDFAEAMKIGLVAVGNRPLFKNQDAA
jgi:hypothetical protein